MKKKAQALIMALIMLLTTVAIPLMDTVSVSAAEDELKVQFHYNREDGNYEGWNVFTWGGISGPYELQQADDGAVAEATVSPGATEVGFIVRYSTADNEWADREWVDAEQSSGDRKVDVSGYLSGTIHVYIESGNFETVVDYAEAVEGEYVAPEFDGLQINFHIDQKKTDDNWGLWLWDDIGTDAVYPLFEPNEDGELVITYNVQPAAGWVGFIVRDDNWAKDPDGDRNVDVSKYVDGTIEVYLKSGEAEFTVDDTNAVAGAKVKSAVYKDSTILVTTSMAVENPAEAFAVVCEDNEVAIASVAAGEEENTYVITLEEKADLTKAYFVVFNENTYEISMPSLYKDEEWVAANTYEGDDLGATWTRLSTTFKVWAPLASEVSVNLYEEGEGGEKLDTVAMTKAEQGVWEVEIPGDLNGIYYTYSVNNAGTVAEACDPYARTTGVNGNRAMVIDLDSTDPEGWENDTNPNADLEFTDAVIWELHVRDASIDESSGVSEANKGNFLGLTEHGDNTVLDHMVDLGITHLHLLPVYDFSSVDETKDGFNWGYDPKNYNVPEGSYSSDPYNGEVRVAEMKEMVQTLHENGISVIMDVVYNHVADAGNFCYNQIVPQYFSRINENGGYSSNSGCGNDTASEHVMVRKYIVESVKYWADEYHIDGFRFDLVGLIDTVTINEIMKEVWSDHPGVVFYGEGWEMNSYDTGVSMTVQNNADEVPGFAFFNDTFRDAIKGSVFDNTTPGYVSGLEGLEEKIEQCFAGAAVWGSEQTVCPTPLQTINYNSCHDNNTLYDRLKLSCPDASEEDIIAMNNLAAAINLTSQGVPFIHAGEEFLRSKPLEDGGYDHNSYSSGDAINSMKWDTLADNIETYEYYKGLIEFRKAHAALRMTDAAEVAANITAIDGLDANVTAFNINAANGETADALFVIFNPNAEATTVALPEGEWNIYVNGEKAGTEVLGTAEGSVTVDGISAMVLVDEAHVHDLEHFDAIAAGCHSIGQIEHWYCADCDTYFADADAKVITNSLSVILPAVGSDNVEHVEAVAPGCHSLGNAEYWYCEDCDTYYADANCAIVTNSKNIILPATGSENVKHVAAVAPTATKDGNSEYWYCEDCKTYYADENCTIVTNVKNVILAATGETNAPQTGDNANIALWVAILGIGVVAVAASVVIKKRNAQ